MGTVSILVISPKCGEESAKTLAESLGADYINPYDVNIKEYWEYNNHEYVFNYGFSKPTKGTALKINKAEAVNISCDKIKCLKLLKGKCQTVVFTEDINEAKSWIDQGRIAVARALVKSNNSKGLVFCYTKEEIDNTPAKFWTRYIDHVAELRINVWKGKVVSIYNKVVKNNHFIFKLIQGQEGQPQLNHIVTQVYEQTGLDWCGIDLLLTAKGNLYFLEVNSAPVLYPYTLKKLTSLVKEFCE